MLDMLTCNYDLTYHHYEKTLNEPCGSVVRNCKFWYQCHTKQIQGQYYRYQKQY